MCPHFLISYPLVRIARHWHRWQLRTGDPSYIFFPSFFFGGLDLAFSEYFIQGLRRSKACPVTLVTAEIPSISFSCWGGQKEEGQRRRGMGNDGTTTTTACGTGNSHAFVAPMHASTSLPPPSLDEWVPRKAGQWGETTSSGGPVDRHEAVGPGERPGESGDINLISWPWSWDERS